MIECCTESKANKNWKSLWAAKRSAIKVKALNKMPIDSLRLLLYLLSEKYISISL